MQVFFKAGKEKNYTSNQAFRTCSASRKYIAQTLYFSRSIFLWQGLSYLHRGYYCLCCLMPGWKLSSVTPCCTDWRLWMHLIPQGMQLHGEVQSPPQSEWEKDWRLTLTKQQLTPTLVTVLLSLDLTCRSIFAVLMGLKQKKNPNYSCVLYILPQPMCRVYFVCHAHFSLLNDKACIALN